MLGSLTRFWEPVSTSVWVTCILRLSHRVPAGPWTPLISVELVYVVCTVEPLDQYPASNLDHYPCPPRQHSHQFIKIME